MGGGGFVLQRGHHLPSRLPVKARWVECYLYTDMSMIYICTVHRRSSFCSKLQSKFENPHHFNSNPDPSCHFNADPDPNFQFYADLVRLRISVDLLFIKKY